MKLDKKQKILLTLVIIALAYLAWQIYSMFFAGPSRPATITPVPAVPTKTLTAAPITSKAPAATTQAATPATTAPAAVMPTQQQPLQQVALMPPMSAYQSEYLQLINRYQLLKMRRQIVDEEAAIASSQAKIAQLNQTTGSTSVAPSTYNPTTTTMTPRDVNQLMYIDYQGGRWSAILNRHHRFKEVYVGTVLSDGTRIMKIDSNGVVIQRHGKQYLLSFYGTTQLSRSQYVSLHPYVPENYSNPQPVPQYSPAVKRYPSKHRSTNISPVVFATTPDNTSNDSINPVPTSPMPTNTAVKQMAPLETIKTTPTAITQPTLPMAAAPTVPIISATNTKGKLPSFSVTVSPMPAAAVSEAPKPAVLDLTPQQKTTVTQLESSITKTPANTDSYSTDEKHLLSLPKTHYTLQIVGSYKLSDLDDIVKANHLQDAFIFHSYYLNKDWYVLIYGDYATEDEATNALKALPPAVQNFKPWVRAMSSVQDAIKLSPQNG